MLHSIFHRGPDEAGRFRDNQIDMGLRRVSIIDLSSGQQPIFNEDGRLAVIFNGEIYNYRDLRQDLIQRGHIFKTNSDTEVIVHLYEEYGEGCVSRLRGMFALAVWDKENRRLFLARDHLGVKPLYFAEVRGALLFASEIKSLLQHPLLAAELDLVALNDYLLLRYVPAPRTLFKSVNMLPAGCWLISDAQGVRTKQYWDVKFEDTPFDGAATAVATDQLTEILQNSVKSQLMSDVPFGAFLSGGIDSSTVVALMTKHLEAPVKTFSVGFEGAGQNEYSELPFARLVAERYHTEHHETFVTAQDFADDLPNIIWHLDQPIADYAQIAYWKVSQLAAQHVKMVLTGEGGDELFAGYGRYAGERYAPLLRNAPESLRSIIRSLSYKTRKFRRQSAALYALSHRDEATRFASWIPLFNHHEKDRLLRPDIEDELRCYHSHRALEQLLDSVEAKDPISRLLYVDTKMWLPDYLLVRGDKLTMAASLEARVPFLDHNLVQFAARLPSKLKLRAGVSKFLLKKATKAWLPPEIINRRKKGFPVPVPVWLRSSARSMMRDLLSRDTISRRGLFNPDYVSRLMKEHESGEADHATKIYGLMSLELWQRQFVDGRSTVTSSETMNVV
jgi:asparagine synthase (glutamine-hydrolysing)